MNLHSELGFGDIHAEEGEGHLHEMGQRNTLNRRKRNNGIRLPCMEE